MKTILVVDDMAIFRDPIAVCLRTKGYNVLSASDGAEGLAILKSQPVDLVLLDIGMPVMDGLGMLQAMSEDPALAKRPTILLTAMSEKDYILRAAKFGVRDYLLKSRFSLKELLTRVADRLATPTPGPASAAAKPVPAPSATVAAGLPAGARAAAKPAAAPEPMPPCKPGEVRRLLTADKCLVRVQRAMSAMRLSAGSAKFVAVATAPGTTEAEVLQAIERDRNLSARLPAVLAAIRVGANAGEGPIASVAGAVESMGMPAVRDVALACAMFDVMPPLAVPAASVGWAAAIASARVAQRLLHGYDSSNDAAAYLAGLCQGLGEVLFRTYFADEYRLVIDAQLATGRRRDDVERVMLGMTSSQLNDMVLEDIGIPGAIRRSVMLAADGTAAAERSSADDPVARVLRLASEYAGAMLPEARGASIVHAYPKANVRVWVGQESPAVGDDRQTRRAASQLADALGGTQSAPNGSASAGPRPTLCVACDPALSAFNPIVAALGAQADLVMVDRLPGSPGDQPGCAGLVVIARSAAAAAGFAGAKVLALATGPWAGASKVLWLVERSDGLARDAAGQPKPVVWPVTAARLAEYVGQIAPVASVVVPAVAKAA